MNVLKIKPGNAITRQYRNLRKSAAAASVGAGVSGVATIKCFAAKQPVEGAVSVGSLAFLSDIAMDMFSSLKKLRPQYKAIVKRAKSIYNK